MEPIATARRIAALLLIGGGLAVAQSSLPATNPTAAPAAASSAAPASIPASAPHIAAHLAEVSFAEGQLKVTADNSSLNQILREISRLTGMKITGGVVDERVFGKYGPAAPAEILSDLLAGTGSNMLLRETASSAPEELILTPQTGGPTPPNPNAAGFDDDAGEPPARQTQFVQRSPRPPFIPPNQPAPNPPASLATSPPNGDPAQASTPAVAPNPPSTGDASPSSPTGVQTPQQVYEQLQRLQQAQPKTQ
jgi:hypothetical protein